MKKIIAIALMLGCSVACGQEIGDVNYIRNDDIFSDSVNILSGGESSFGNGIEMFNYNPPKEKKYRSEWKTEKDWYEQKSKELSNLNVPFSLRGIFYYNQYGTQYVVSNGSTIEWYQDWRNDNQNYFLNLVRGYAKKYYPNKNERNNFAIRLNLNVVSDYNAMNDDSGYHVLDNSDFAMGPFFRNVPTYQIELWEKVRNSYVTFKLTDGLGVYEFIIDAKAGVTSQGYRMVYVTETSCYMEPKLYLYLDYDVAIKVSDDYYKKCYEGCGSRVRFCDVVKVRDLVSYCFLGYSSESVSPKLPNGVEYNRENYINYIIEETANMFGMEVVE